MKFIEPLLISFLFVFTVQLLKELEVETLFLDSFVLPDNVCLVWVNKAFEEELSFTKTFSKC